MGNNSKKKRKDDNAGAAQDSIHDETILDLIRFAQIPWFVPNDQYSTVNPPGFFPNKASPDVSLVDTARALADRARGNDPDAALRLFLMAAVSQVEVWALMREGNPAFKALAAHTTYLPVPFSPLANINSGFSRFLLMIKVGKMLLNVKAKGNLETQANAFALHLLGFMLIAKRGIVTEPIYQKWIPVCKKLPPLSSQTWKQWWETGKDICKEMFPNLEQMFYGQEAGKPKKYNGDAVHRLGQSFAKLWQIFEAVESVSKIKSE